MNWVDLLVLAIILGFGIVGLVNGFIFSIFRVVSFFLSIIISIKFYPVIANFLMKTPLYTNIQESILKNLLMQKFQSPETNTEVKKAAADTIINGLNLPGFLKGTLINQIPDPTKLIDVHKVMEIVSGKLAGFVIDIISLVVLYIIVRIALIFVRFILQGIAKLPIFKQMDKLGGFAFGAVEGLLTIYILCAILMLLRAMPQFKTFFEGLETSLFANYFYQHNFIVEFMFSKK
jgi:uncharacterized membrane protein required for colicin V production